MREAALGAFEDQEVPLELVIPATRVRHEAGRPTLFQVMFVLQNNTLPQAGPPGLALSALDPGQGSGTSKFDLALGFEDRPESFLGSLEFNTDLFGPTTIERFSRHYIQTLENLIAHPELRLADLPPLSDEEGERVLEWGNTPVFGTDEATGHEDQAREWNTLDVLT